MLLELERRGAELAYLRTASGYEVDFHARLPEGRVLLVQVCARIESEETWAREVRALLEAAAEHPGTEPWLITIEPLPAGKTLPQPLCHVLAAEWFLEKSP